MDRRFEKNLSQILSLLVLIVFVATLATMNVNIWAVTYIWAISFLLAWLMMLIYSLYVLMQKDSLAYSILTAIVTALAFAILSIPAILVISRFIPQLPQGLSFGLGLLDQNSQLILYTSLIAVYFVHTINSIKLRSYNEKVIEFSEEEDIIDENNKEQSEIIDEDIASEDINLVENDTDSEREIINEDYQKDLSLDKSSTNDISFNKEINQEITNLSSEDLEFGEKIVFEPEIVKNEDYDLGNIKLVEDLTEEDLESMKGMDNNG